MRALDVFLQRWRIARSIPHVRRGDRLLDVGCYDRSLISRVEDRIERAVGIDPMAEPYREGKVEILRGSFPIDTDFEAESFDCITLLAVLEHARDPEALGRALFRVLSEGGRLVLTVPHPFVDRILDVLLRLRLIDGMDVEEHHGFELATAMPVLHDIGFRVVHDERFQLGLNRLLVLEKPSARPPNHGAMSS